MNNKLILLCLLFIGSSSFSQEATPKFSKAKPLGFTLPEGYKKVIVPFELYNNLIVIDVLLNGSLPLKLVLDTGVRTTVLTEKTLTDLLNLKYARKITIPGAGGEKLVNAFVVNNVSLNIGRIEGRGHTMLVLEEDLLQLKSFLGVNVHGILGYELFSRFIVDVNYSKKIITFSDPSNFKKKSSFHEIHISIEDTKPYILANFIIRGSGVVRGKFMLDTGASHTMLLDRRSSRKIFVPQPNISTTLGRGLAGIVYGEVARVDKMWLNKYMFEGIIVTFPDENSYEISLDRNFRNGTFGGGLMSRFHIIFDFVNSKVYIKKGQGYHKPFEFNLSGLIVKATGVYLRNYEIDDVRKNSTAEAAGLKTGDEIITINGELVRELNLDQVMNLLNEKVNKKIKLIILRERRLLNFQYKLKRLI
jgi:predicted aspartyl protease